MTKSKPLERPLKLIYLISVCLLAASMPFSYFATSNAIMLISLTWLTGFFVFPYKKRIAVNQEVFWFILIYVLHIVWLWNTSNFDYATEDLRKKLPLLILPLIFASMPAFNRLSRNIILHIFLLAIFVSGIFVFLSWGGIIGEGSEDTRNFSPFINHIRLSLMMSLSIFIAAWYIGKTTNTKLRAVYIFSITFNLAAMVVLQVLTGLIITLLTFFILTLINFHKLQNKRIKTALISLMIALPLIIGAYLFYQIHAFYHPEKAYPETFDIKTRQGNPYQHNLHSQIIENGNYVYRFIVFDELEKAWNRQSEIKYDSLSQNGYEIKHILIRYLTSKGEFKDAEAVNNLSEKEIQAIESGISNERFIDKQGINSRLYALIWQMHIYFHGGNPSGKSLIQRVVYLETGWHIARDNLLTGIGTGDVNDVFKHQYRRDNSPLLPQFRRRTHNQYLTMLISFGIFGFILFLMGWIIPVIRKKGMKNFLFASFFIIASLSMLNEDSMETLTGSTFIAFFYSLFLWGINHRTMFQEKFMKKAIQLAKDNIPSGNGPFGAVIVKDGEIISEAVNEVTRNNDPTAHAEVNAIRKACDKLKTFDLSGCEIYSSCEPCPMCLGAIYWARLEKLYFASGRKEAAGAGFSDEFIYDELGKTIRERSIPTRQMMQKDAESVFKSWKDFEDKILY
ncbi:MAG: deaminase [Bacteroidota bacterium]